VRNPSTPSSAAASVSPHLLLLPLFASEGFCPACLSGELICGRVCLNLFLDRK
jgi:hypothetical protein